MDSESDSLRIIESLKTIGIPQRPDILINIETESRKESPDFKKIEQWASSDMAISAALLKTINSPFYGLRAKVSTVRQAISMLGLTAVTRVIAGMALRSIGSGTNQKTAERILEEASELALVAGYIARNLHMNPDHAFTYGLFQSCGSLLMLARFQDYEQTLAMAARTLDKTLAQLEFDRHGIDHAQVGAMVSSKWGIQDSITQAILYHHCYSEITREHCRLALSGRDLSDAQDLMAVGLLAERAIRYHTGFDRTAEWKAGGRIALDHFGLSEGDFQGLAEDVMDVLSAAG